MTKPTTRTNHHTQTPTHCIFLNRFADESYDAGLLFRSDVRLGNIALKDMIYGAIVGGVDRCVYTMLHWLHRPLAGL